MFELEFGKITNAFNQAKKILIITHKNPDGDAVGSSLALKIYLEESAQKEVAVYTVGPVAAAFDFLPKTETITTDISVFKKPWDLIVVLDCGDLDHAGIDSALMPKTPVVNIDHHIGNKKFGQVNLVDERAVAVCEIIFKFLEFCHWPIGRKIATCLLCGILYDTRGFSNVSTSGESIKIGGELVRMGAKISDVVSHGVRNKTINGLRLWGLILSRFKINRKLDLAYTYVKEEDFNIFAVTKEEVNGLASFFNVISDVSIAIFIQIGKDQSQFSLRTTKDNVDVAKIAGFFGGGGHKKAAGFIVPWRIEEVDGGLEVV